MFEKNPETVKIAYKHLPLRSHNMAGPAALASMAANDQGKFWEYHDKLFAEQKIVPASFDRIATELELDLDKFKDDMKSQRLQRIVAQDTADAGRIGVTGTPTIFINGSKLKQRSLQGFQAQIDAELAKVE
ncbi:MAG: DsbA family protein [Desulfofustis sp.]|nr:DsbA family protein [Desulfofustis sp.]NNK57423.1 thioredoxin domain-containing protein [Desulfofustis sp.]